MTNAITSRVRENTSTLSFLSIAFKNKISYQALGRVILILYSYSIVQYSIKYLCRTRDAAITRRVRFTFGLVGGCCCYLFAVLRGPPYRTAYTAHRTQLIRTL